MSSGMPHFAAQNAYMRQAAPTMVAADISSAPTSYNAPKGATDSAQKLSATHQKTLSAAPVMKRPKGNSLRISIIELSNQTSYSTFKDIQQCLCRAR